MEKEEQDKLTGKEEGEKGPSWKRGEGDTAGGGEDRREMCRRKRRAEQSKDVH